MKAHSGCWVGGNWIVGAVVEAIVLARERDDSGAGGDEERGM